MDNINRWTQEEFARLLPDCLSALAAISADSASDFPELEVLMFCDGVVALESGRFPEYLEGVQRVAALAIVLMGVAGAVTCCMS